jgi:RNA polymerase sigma-70 factor (ECF subfamily)
MNQNVARVSDPTSPGRLSVEALVQDCLPSVQKWAHGRFPRVARPEFDTQDLVQEAALRMLSRGKRFEPRHAYAVQAYMRQTVLNLARDRARRLVHREEPLERGDEYPCQEAGPLECAIDQEHRARYEEALRSLTSKDRRILVARVKHELNATDIAHAFGLPSPDAARMAIARATKRLMHKLSRKK